MKVNEKREEKYWLFLYFETQSFSAALKAGTVSLFTHHLATSAKSSLK